MTTQTNFIAHPDWTHIESQLDQEGYAILPSFVNDKQVRELTVQLDTISPADRVSLASERLGRGELFYVSQLPVLLENLRVVFYTQLAIIANRWNATLDVAKRYPEKLDTFLLQNRKAGQDRAQSNLSCLQTGDYQALHQRSEGQQVFPLQLVMLLSEPGRDFTGGEFVMAEQRPRMQSRPMVLPLHRGDVAIITVAQRPVKGGKGYYRVNLKHAISRVRGGQRIGLELLFHDAKRG